MARDVFGASVKDGGIYNAQSVTYQIGKINYGVVASLTYNYQRSVQPLYSITTTAVYHVIGRAAGQGTMAAIIGPKNGLGSDYLTDIVGGDPCESGVITIKNDSKCGVLYTRNLKGVIPSAINATIQAQDMLVNENVSFNFATIET